MIKSPEETQDAASLPWPRSGRSPLRSFEQGQLIDGRYVVRGWIGRGGMGTVLQVENLRNGLLQALKYSHGSGLRQKRLVREARILGSLKHPHVLPVIDANLNHDPPYFVMPLAERSLDSELARYVGDPAQTLQVFRQVCLGVQAFHNVGVVHRDLKPANILRLDGDRHVVADLGAAKREPRDSTVLTRTSAVLGTLTYLAPEQFTPGGTREADVRTDIYQLGKILYQMVTGRTPAVVEPSALPPGLAHLVLRATATHPDDRYPDISDLLDATDAFLQTAHRPNNPSEPLEALAQLVENSQAGEPYRGERQDEFLQALSRLDGRHPAQVIEGFDRVPLPVLAALAKDRPTSFLIALNTYSQAIEDQVARRHFDYADLVALRMKSIVRSSRHTGVQSRALQVLLVTAVTLNRYAAMNVFKDLLYRIKTVDLALPVAEMLRAHRDFFQEIAPTLNPDRLHPIIRRVLDDLIWIETVSF